MEFLKTFAHVLGTYKSPLAFDQVYHVGMFETAWSSEQTKFPFTALNTELNCLYFTRSGTDNHQNCCTGEAVGRRSIF